MPFASGATSAIGYFRLHGRNSNWLNAPASVRYDKLYNNNEMPEFIPPIHDMAAKTSTVLIFFNNCHAGSAAKNFIMLPQMLSKSEPNTP